MTLAAGLSRGKVLYLTVAQRFGIITSTNPRRLPDSEFAAYFPTYWEPTQKRPLVIAIHGTTTPATNPTYYKDMMGHLPAFAPNGGSSGSIGAAQNGPDFAFLSGTTPVPVPAGFAAIGPTWHDLAEKHNFAVICVRNYYAGSLQFDRAAASVGFPDYAFNRLGYGGVGRCYDFASINCIKTAVDFLINTVSMVHPQAKKFGTGHSSGGALLGLMAYRNPGYFSKLVFCHNQAIERTQAEQNFGLVSGDARAGRTWDYDPVTWDFTNIQSPCPGGSSSYNDATGNCDLIASDFDYRSGAGLTALQNTPQLVISGDNDTDGAFTGETYCDTTDVGMSAYGTPLGLPIFTVEYSASGQHAFQGFDPAIYGPTVPSTGMRFYPHGAHDFGKTAAVEFFFYENPTSTRYF